MRLGCFCQIEDMTALADAGYDFAETGLEVLYLSLDDDDFRRAREFLRAEPLFPEVVQAPDLLGWAMAAEGDGPPIDLRGLFRRAAMVGAKLLVVSAPGRDALKRFSGQAQAWRQAAESAGLLAQHAATSGLTIAITPGRAEDSLAATIEEVWVLAEEVGHPAVGVAAEVSAIEDWADVAAAGPTLRHIYLPLPGRFGGPFSTEWFFEALHALREFGYTGRATIAADWATLAPRAADLLEEIRAAVGRG